MKTLTAEDREAGLLLNFTGDGKGKTSAALGTVLRALGWGWRVAVLQFLKGERPTGEREFFQRYFPEVLFESRGLGRTIRPGDHEGEARRAWTRAAELLRDFDGDLLVLDELNVALGHGFLEPEEVLPALRGRRKALNVIITGRYAPAELLAQSDLVSEIGAVKHPYRQGVSARKGLDY